MTKGECKGGKSATALAKLIEYAIQNKQRVWYSEFYNKWLTQEYSTRHNFKLMFDFRKKTFNYGLTRIS